MQGSYVCDLPANCVEEHYNKIDKAPAPLYNVVWMVQGVIKEHALQNVSYALCKHKINELKKESRYEGGLLMPAQSHLS